MFILNFGLSIALLSLFRAKPYSKGTLSMVCIAYRSPQTHRPQNLLSLVSEQHSMVGTSGWLIPMLLSFGASFLYSSYLFHQIIFPTFVNHVKWLKAIVYLLRMLILLLFCLLTWYTRMFGVLLPYFLLMEIVIFCSLLMIAQSMYGSIYYLINRKFFPHSYTFTKWFKHSFTPPSKISKVIGVVSTEMSHNFFTPRVLITASLVTTLMSKMVQLNAATASFLKKA